ncbi:MAG: hypothetical protein ACRC28_16265 [Clostridium sp.]|uniref:hypothetical protein n=1 Tax=Clostridium sp. TaxID=1506 RepID=UPI003F33B9CD
MLKTIIEQKDEEDYKFKFEIQKILNSLSFEKYLEIMDSLELATESFEKTLELNSLNMLHLEMEDYIYLNLNTYLK